MTLGDVILLSIGVILILGAFVSAWVFFRILKQLEDKKNNSPTTTASVQQDTEAS